MGAVQKLGVVRMSCDGLGREPVTSFKLYASKKQFLDHFQPVLAQPL